MNVTRATLQRRRFLRSSSVLALGAASTLCAAHKLLQTPASPSLALQPEPSPPPRPESPPPVVELQPDSDPAIDTLWETEPLPSTGRALENEEEYRDFLVSLELRHLSPAEIIDPHRGIIDDIENTLPPLDIWEKLIPTLRTADEIRERLQAPLCRITSGYRNPRYNAEVPGSVPGSYHTRNQALDLVYFCSSRKAFQVALDLRREGFFRGGVGLYPSFIHLDTRGYAATWRKV